MSHNDGQGPLELIFLGTGTSSSLPNIKCLTALPDDKPCRTCLSTLKPEGKKNIRRNTSCAFRTTTRDGRKVTIVIDAGKNFQAAALEWFPKHGLRKIDALLLTHGHADAMNGLDDLRGWTLSSAIQSVIDIYASQDTFNDVRRSFPYLVAKEFASGGGAVPSFRWHIIHDSVPFEVLDTGVYVTPFLVHHGQTQPNVPDPLRRSGVLQSANVVGQGIVHPYLCFGFKIGHEIIYLSDVSFIPEDKWQILERANGDGPLPVLVLDCLRLQPYASHIGFEESIRTAQRVGATRTYLLGFSHHVGHDEYVTLGEAVGGKRIEVDKLTEMEEMGLRLIPAGRKVWVRPAYDGLRVVIEEDRRVWDDGYSTE